MDQRIRPWSESWIPLWATALCMATTNGLALDLESVLEKASIVPPARVEFREERHNKLLKEVLVMTGYLEYLKEGVLRKVVENPFQEAFLIDAGRIQVERGGEIEVLHIKHSRSLRTILVGIEAVLAGQTDRLTSVFDYTLSGTEDDWCMRLVPRSKRIVRQLESLEVTGDSQSITSIRFDLQGGEWHRMDILRADAAR